MANKKTAPKSATPDKQAEELNAQNEEAAENLIASSEKTADKVVDQDAERRNDDDEGEVDVVDDVVAEQAERRRRRANSDAEVAAIDEAEAVRLSTETKLPDTPSGLVQVAVTDAKILNLPRPVPGQKGPIVFEDGVATVTREVAEELKLHYPQQVKIL